MAEISIDYLTSDNEATWYSDSSPIITRMLKMVEEFPEDCKIKIDGTKEESPHLTISIPKTWVRMPKKPATRTITEEQKVAASKRFAEYRKNKNKDK